MPTSDSTHNAMIQLDNVSVRRGATEVLHGISAEIPAGEITAVVGPSGVGKSTLLAALTGLIRPAAGNIIVDGVGALEPGKCLREYRRRTATVFQEHALIERLPAIENVLLGLADQRHPLSLLPWPETLCHRAAQALDAVGLLHRATVRTGHLSGGERQRVGVARALVREPKLLLGDEPFSSVDPRLAGQMGSLLRQMVEKNGMTVVVVMHQLDMALNLADKVIALAEGRVAFDGKPGHFGPSRQARVFRSSFPALGTCSAT